MSSTSLSSRILYQDNHLIIVNKMPKELVQGDETGDITLADLVKSYIKEAEHKPGNVFLGIPHRLDRPVSGVVIYAKTSKGLARMSDLFRLKEIDKRYWAIVEKMPEKPEGTLTHSLLKNHKQNKSYVVDDGRKGSKVATLHYKWVFSSDNYHLIEVNLETGRHHQIRVQLAHIGCIIKGDVKYGARRGNGDGSICLHSRRAKFTHPIKNVPIDVTAPCVDEPIWDFFENKIEKN
ncbi:MAG: pseudouridine synthase [Salibacteraceae bacterium]